MPYDPRMLQMAQMGVGMMGPQQGGQRPKQWWEQPLPAGRSGGAQSPQDDPSNPVDPSKSKPPPGLMQMLMLGGKPTYSGTPSGSPSSGSYGAGGMGSNPWGWLGSMFGGPSTGPR